MSMFLIIVCFQTFSACNGKVWLYIQFCFLSVNLHYTNCTLLLILQISRALLPHSPGTSVMFERECHINGPFLHVVQSKYFLTSHIDI